MGVSSSQQYGLCNHFLLKEFFDPSNFLFAPEKKSGNNSLSTKPKMWTRARQKSPLQVGGGLSLVRIHTEGSRIGKKISYSKKYMAGKNLLYVASQYNFATRILLIKYGKHYLPPPLRVAANKGGGHGSRRQSALRQSAPRQCAPRQSAPEKRCPEDNMPGDNLYSPRNPWVVYV